MDAPDTATHCCVAYFGGTYRYRPDFVVRLTSGLMVLLEGKGDPSEKDDEKATAARRWVQAVNTWGGLGTWVHHICYDAAKLKADLITLQDKAPAAERRLTRAAP